MFHSYKYITDGASLAFCRLALGCISPRYIYHQIQQYEKERTANQSTYWVIFELLWRDYFKLVGVKYGNRLFQIKGLQEKSVPWKKDMKLFDAWKVTMWVPELQGIMGSDVHTPWTLSSTASLSHANVCLGETYPTPIVMAPEWSRHANKKPSGAGSSARGKKGPSHTPKQHRDRGIDFYFSK
ncbi:hypothetical protein F7725_029135, partial [Dissostichus mawsoni]